MLSFLGNAQESIDNLSKTFLNLGVKSIQVEKTAKGLEYTFVTVKKCYINASKVDLKRYKIVNVENNYFLLDSENQDINYKYSISLNTKTQTASYVTPLYKGDLNSALEELYNDKDFVFLYLFLREINLDSTQDFARFDNSQANNINGGCSFWDTYYSVGIGASDAAALANLNYVMSNSIQDGDFDGCTKISTKPEYSTYLGIHISTITWCCK